MPSYFRLLLIVVLAFTFPACTKFDWSIPKDKPPIEIKITDEQGKEITEVYSGMMITLQSEDFKKLNDQGLLKSGGHVFFDQVEGTIVAAFENQLKVIVPILNKTLPYEIAIDIRLDYLQQFRWLCRRCRIIIYLPSFYGNVFSGRADGETDGSYQMPAEMTYDGSGNLYIIDQRPDHDLVLKLSPDGTATTFAGAAREFGRLVGIGLNRTNNSIYVADATAQQVKYFTLGAPGTVSVLAGDGSVGNVNGTGTAASFRFGTQRVDDFGLNERGQGLCIDNAGNIYVGNLLPGSGNSEIRRITSAGEVTTVPGSTIIAMGPEDPFAAAGITVTPEGVLYYTGGASSLFQGVGRVDPTGIAKISGAVSNEQLVDGSPTSSRYTYPKAIQYFNGKLYVADGSNGALRRVDLSGKSYTMAGVGHFETPSFADPSRIPPPVEGSYPLISAAPLTPFNQNAKRIVMDQVGGIAVLNESLIYVSDYAYKCIWKFTVR